MKKFLSIKGLMLLALTATTFVSCKEDKLNVVDNPLLFSETTMTIQQFTTKQLSVTNPGIDPATIIYTSSNKDVATINNNVLTALIPGETSITAFVEGQYLSTFSTVACVVTVTSDAPTGIQFVTALDDFKSVPLFTETNVLFKIVPQTASGTVVVNSSDTVLNNIRYTVKMAPLNSPNPDTLVMNPMRIGDLNLTLSIKDTKLTTAEADINISDIKPTSMELHLYNEKDSIQVDDLYTGKSIENGESIILWAKFNPAKNSYQELKTILSETEYVTAIPELVTFKTKTYDNKNDSTHTRPGILITAVANNPQSQEYTEVTVLNNSGLAVAFNIWVDKGEMVYTQTITAPAEKITLLSTKDNENGEVLLALPTFDFGVTDTDFEISYDFTQLKDKAGKDLPMLTEKDMLLRKNYNDDYDVIGYTAMKNYDYTNQGFANAVFTAVTREWDNSTNQEIVTPLKDKAGKVITDTMLVEIPQNVWYNEYAEYKQAYTFNNTDKEYSLRVSIFATSSLYLSNVEATLYRNTYKMVDKKEVLDKTIKVGETITLAPNGQIAFEGTFAPFEGQVDDKELKNYFVKYEMTASSYYYYSKFSNIVETIIPDDGFATRNIR